jgi:hypothetical protein
MATQQGTVLFKNKSIEMLECKIQAVNTATAVLSWDGVGSNNDGDGFYSATCVLVDSTTIQVFRRADSEQVLVHWEITD